MSYNLLINVCVCFPFISDHCTHVKGQSFSALFLPCGSSEGRQKNEGFYYSAPRASVFLEQCFFFFGVYSESLDSATRLTISTTVLAHFPHFKMNIEVCSNLRFVKIVFVSVVSFKNVETGLD